MDDLQINPTAPKTKSGDADKKTQETESLDNRNLQASDYLVKDAGFGSEILDKIKKKPVNTEEEVVYGKYDNRDRGIFVRLNDFLIDHTGVTLKDKSYFFHMLSVMVDSGIPVVQAIRSLARHSENLKFKRVLNTVAHDCGEGATLYNAMSRFEEVFTEAELGIVRSGEATGKLNTLLYKLSVDLEKKGDLRMKLIGAAVYPVMVISLLVVVAIGMLVWVLPTLLGILTQAGVTEDKLPLATRILIALQSGFVDYWWLILAVILLVYGFFKIYNGTDYGAVRTDYRVLTLPVIGKLVKKVNVLNFVGLLGLLIESGLPIIKSLQITGNAITNRVYKLKIQDIINKVKTGSKISESLEDSDFLFSHEVGEVLRVGEISASLSKVSEKISNQYQKEVDNTLKQLTAIFEPVMVLIVGICVAVLALAIMAPIFNLTSVISN